MRYSDQFSLWVAYSVVIMCLISCSTEKPPAKVPESVVLKMNAQEAAWNDGDIKAFMEIAYWNSESLLFVGRKGPTFGFQGTLENYLKNYSSQTEMGRLQFELIHWQQLGTKHGLLVGSWSLHRDSQIDDLSGHFSLIWERKSDLGWVIIADHSS